MQNAGLRAGHRPGRDAVQELHPARAVPVRDRRPASCTTPATTRPRCARRSTRSATRRCARSSGRAREGRLHRHRHRALHRGVGAGPSKNYDIPGLKMIDSAELRVHPTGKAILKLGVKSQGQGHETTFAQIVAEELGHPVERHQGAGGRHRQHAVRARHLRVALDAGRAARPPRWWRASSPTRPRRSPPTCSRRPRTTSSARRAGSRSRGAPDRSATIQDVALAAYTNLPDGMEYGLEGVHYYDPPNLTFPYGSYVVVVEVDAETGVWKVQRMVALDDCGVRINPMIVEGQIHGGLTEGFAHVVDAVDHLRRRRQLHRLELHGLPDPRPRGRRRSSSCSRPSCRRRTTRSAPRASASRPPSARRRRT